MSTTLVVGLLLLLPIFQAMAVEAVPISFEYSSLQACSLTDALMDPTYEKRYGVDVVWQIPSSPKGVLLLAHGAGMDALSYFDPGLQCEDCYGLPEERNAVLEALRRGYAVIVVKSIGFAYDTHWPIEPSKDLVIVTNIMTEWRREHALDNLPLAIWGHSAGTSLAGALTRRISVQALIFMCGSGLSNLYDMANPLQFPPILFAYMPVDYNNTGLNVTGLDATAMAILRERGVPVAEAQCWPKPLSPLFFAENILCMSDEISRKIFAAYEAAGWVDGNGYLIINPSTSMDWESVLLDALPFCAASRDPCRVAHVEQELKSAFAEHSFTSDADDIIFPWLDSIILSSPGESLSASV